MTIPQELQGILAADADILSGAVRFKGTRVPVQALLDTLLCNHTIDYFLEGFPDVTKAQAEAVLRWEQNLSRSAFGLEQVSQLKVLLDNCVDTRVKRLIVGHDVSHARDHGWQEYTNGKLLAAAEQAGFEVFVTVDKNLRYQQNLASKGLGVVTLSPRLAEFDYVTPLAEQLVVELDRGIVPGSDLVISPKP